MKNTTRNWLLRIAINKKNSKAIEIVEYIKELELIVFGGCLTKDNIEFIKNRNLEQKKLNQTTGDR